MTAVGPNSDLPQCRHFGRYQVQSRPRQNRCYKTCYKIGVCTENSNSDIMVMQSAKDRLGMDTSSSLNWARERRVLI